MRSIYPHWDEEHELEWRRSFGPPVRPTTGECKIYRRELLRLGKASKVLLMGSTPELSDIVAELGFDLTIIDEKERNYQDIPAMTTAQVQRERFIRMNWLEMTFSSEFDFIIGDNVLSILPPESALKLIEKVHTALKPEARWVTRVMLFNDGEDFISPDTINGRVSRCLTKKDIYEQLYVPFLTYYKNEVGGAKISEIYSKISRDVEKGIFPKVCTEVFQTLSDYEEENFLVGRKEFEKMIGEKFDVVRSYDYVEKYSRNWVIYVLKKK